MRNPNASQDSLLRKVTLALRPLDPGASQFAPLTRITEDRIIRAGAFVLVIVFLIHGASGEGADYDRTGGLLARHVLSERDSKP